MIKGTFSTLALFAASPAMAHVNGPHLHPHGFETTAAAIGAIILAAVVWRIMSRRVAT